MSVYAFTTLWRTSAPLEAVWDAIYHSEQWPDWWRGVESVVELQKGDESGVGSVRRYAWKSRLPYRLTFDVLTVRVEPLSLLEGRATGELEGTGLWRLWREEGDTLVRYDWQVSTRKRWMNRIAPLARPLFRWNHDVIMAWGAEGLTRRLGASVKVMAVRELPEVG